MSFDTIDLLTGKVFQVTWDTGRRCNYDCSYCPVHRHDNFSRHATLDELKKNVDFLYEYTDLYMQHRSYKVANFGFTGGEPTVNPNFIPFAQYLKQQYQEKYADRWEAGFALTTNGAMGEKMGQAVMENFGHATVSYHSESDDKLKQQVKDRILQFHYQGPLNNFTVSVNVMFHAEYFDECIELCNFLRSHAVDFVPRVIGEEPDSRPTFAHKYNEEQLQWFKNYWIEKNANKNDEKETADRLRATGEPTNEKKKLGNSIGRPCCGSRDMLLTSGNVSKRSNFVDFRQFQGWSCSVNWFFLHLEQQTDSVYHHQTCQAKFDGGRGRIGKLSEGDKIIANLKDMLENKQMPVISCPKHTCGCGLCAPKSKFEDKFLQTLNDHIDIGVLDVNNRQQ
jgi:sulfatase maturation enzyme AslB (radical SAM superfamily)